MRNEVARLHANSEIAMAIGLKQIPKHPHGSLWDPKENRTRLLLGSDMDRARKAYGSVSKAGDGYVFDVFLSAEDALRAEADLGLDMTLEARAERILEIARKANKQVDNRSDGMIA